MTEALPVQPLRSTMAGIELVTIPVWHYAELLECRRAWQASEHAGPSRQMHPAVLAIDPRSRLFAYPEVAIHLYDVFGRTTLQDAAASCLEQFGSVRAPSRATIGRYWARLRKGL